MQNPPRIEGDTRFVYYEEQGQYLVGYWMPDKRFFAERVCRSSDEAAERCHYLNGAHSRCDVLMPMVKALEPLTKLARSKRLMKLLVEHLDTLEKIDEERWEKPPYKYLRQPVTGIELSTRTQTCFHWENIKFIGDICFLTQGELLKIPNFGRKSLNEVTLYLKSLGLRTGMNIPEWTEIREKLLVLEQRSDAL